MALIARVTDTTTGQTTEIEVTKAGYVAAYRGNKNRGDLRVRRGRPSNTKEQVLATIEASRVDATGRRNPAKRRSDVAAQLLVANDGRTFLAEA